MFFRTGTRPRLHLLHERVVMIALVVYKAGLNVCSSKVSLRVSYSYFGSCEIDRERHGWNRTCADT